MKKTLNIKVYEIEKINEKILSYNFLFNLCKLIYKTFTTLSHVFLTFETW